MERLLKLHATKKARRFQRALKILFRANYSAFASIERLTAPEGVTIVGF